MTEHVYSNPKHNIPQEFYDIGDSITISGLQQYPIGVSGGGHGYSTAFDPRQSQMVHYAVPLANTTNGFPDKIIINGETFHIEKIEGRYENGRVRTTLELVSFK